MWIPIFRTGTHTDSAGNTRQYTAEELDRRVSLYNGQPESQRRLAPHVLGHPRTDAPAYGWVKELKRVGDTLFGYTKQFSPEFVDKLRRGEYKFRSCAFYPDGLLRHVGWLGAAQPAVAGLGEVEFAEGDAIVVEFAEGEFADVRMPRAAGVFRRLREFLIGEHGQEVADRVVPEDDLQVLSRPMPEVPVWLENAVEDLYKTQTQQQTAASSFTQSKGDDMPETKPGEFEEQLRQEKARNTELETQLQQSERKQRNVEFAAFCDQHKTRVTPARRPVVIGLMHVLANEGEHQFSETDKRTPLAAFQDFCANHLSEDVKVGELATASTAVTGTGKAAADPAAIAREASEYREAQMAKGHVITVTEAVAHVMKSAQA